MAKTVNKAGQSNINYHVYLYDTLCNPLNLTAAYIEAHKSANGFWLDSQQPKWSPISSECCATLGWSGVAEEVHFYLDDPNATYVAKTVHGLNGKTGGRFDLVVHKLPGKMHGGGKPAGVSTSQFVDWAQSAEHWTQQQRDAAKVLLGNVADISAYLLSPEPLPELETIAAHWLRALEAVGFPVEMLALYDRMLVRN